MFKQTMMAMAAFAMTATAGFTPAMARDADIVVAGEVTKHVGEVDARIAKAHNRIAKLLTDIDKFDAAEREARIDAEAARVDYAELSGTVGHVTGPDEARRVAKRLANVAVKWESADDKRRNAAKGALTARKAHAKEERKLAKLSTEKMQSMKQGKAGPIAVR